MIGIDLADWFPRLVEASIPVPRTRIVRAPADLIALLDGETPAGFGAFLAELEAAGDEIGYPLFLRTGFGSGKHDWVDTCLVTSADDLGQHVFALVEWSEMVDVMGLPTTTWAVRELLPTDPAFTAFSGHLPITRERRYFVEDGRVVGYHPYWPPFAIESPSVSDWEVRLSALNEMPPEEVSELTALAERVSTAVPGAWSVDFLHVPDRGWLCIDMAHTARSFIWRDHPCAPKVFA